MGKFWFVILILLLVAMFRSTVLVEQKYWPSDLVIDEELKVNNYPEFSKNVQYFDTDYGRLVTDRWPKFEKGEILLVKGEYLVEKEAIWFPEIDSISKPTGIQGFLNVIRNSISYKINHYFDHQSSELILGMLIGQNDLTPDLSEQLKRSGVIHVVVVSGQNLTMIFAFLALWGRYTRRKVFLMISVMILSVYVFLVGMDPPVVRAYLMILVVILAELLGRKYSSVQALVLTAVVMVAYNPLYIGEVSFRLSFLASLGVLVGIKVTTLLNMAQKGFLKYLVEVYITSFFAWLMTAPVIIISFGSLSVVAPIVNLAVLWLVPIIMVGGTIFMLVPDFLSSIFSYFLQILVNGFLVVVKEFAKIDIDIYEANSNISLYIVIFSYILILTLIKLFLKIK